MFTKGFAASGNTSTTPIPQLADFLVVGGGGGGGTNRN